VNLFKKKAVLLSTIYRYTNVKHEPEGSKTDVCELKIQLPSKEIVTVKGFCQTKTESMILVCFVLYFPDGEKYHNYAVQSTIDTSEMYVHLDSIEVPDNLRNMGMGTILFQEWIYSVYKLLKIKELNITKVCGEIGDGKTYTPKFSVKLYHKFANHQIDEKKRLRLVTCNKATCELEYVLEDIK
jgi:hypothetical protein